MQLSNVRTPLGRTTATVVNSNGRLWAIGGPRGAGHYGDYCGGSSFINYGRQRTTTETKYHDFRYDDRRYWAISGLQIIMSWPSSVCVHGLPLVVAYNMSGCENAFQLWMWGVKGSILTRAWLGAVFEFSGACADSLDSKQKGKRGRTSLSCTD